MNRTVAGTVAYEVVAEAMQAAWDDFVADTGCFPDCFELLPGRKLTAEFDRGNFHRFVTDWLVLRGVDFATVRPGEPRAIRLAERTAVAVENDRLREGLHRLVDQNYDAGYTPESYADAVLSGHEPLLVTCPHCGHVGETDDGECNGCGQFVNVPSGSATSGATDTTSDAQLRPDPETA